MDKSLRVFDSNPGSAGFEIKWTGPSRPMPIQTNTPSILHMCLVRQSRRSWRAVIRKKSEKSHESQQPAVGNACVDSFFSVASLSAAIPNKLARELRLRWSGKDRDNFGSDAGWVSELWAEGWQSKHNLCVGQAEHTGNHHKFISVQDCKKYELFGFTWHYQKQNIFSNFQKQNVKETKSS